MDSAENTARSNGFGAAAVLSAGVGSAVLGICSASSDLSPAAKQFFQFYRPSGPLSGVSTVAVLVWVICWVALSVAWRNRSVGLARINVISFLLLIVGLLLTFPPFVDLL